MPRKLKMFYEVQQKASSGRWVKIGYFSTKKAAEKYCTKFNVGTVVAPIKIVERNFLA